MADGRIDQSTRSVGPAPTGGDAWLEPRREDLAALVASYRAATQGRKQGAWVVGGLGGLALGAGLITVGEALKWPALLFPWFFALGWAIMLGCGAVLWRNERRARALYQFNCPACGVPLIDGTLGRTSPGRADLAVASGNCPACGERILAP